MQHVRENTQRGITKDAPLTLSRAGRSGQWLVPRFLLGIFGAYVLFRAVALVETNHVNALWLKDYDLYMDATRSWLAGGSFYPAWQTSGPWTLEWGAILYPPVMLFLFVPFVHLPAWLWVLLPLTVTLAVIAWHRPGPWRLALMVMLLSIDPLGLLNYTAGTPTIWFVMFMALATRWPWWSALILAKPTLLPFALIGIPSRNWWLATAALAIGTLLLWSMTVTWVGVLLDQRGSDALYSVLNVPLMLVPLVAAIGHTSRSSLKNISVTPRLKRSVPREHAPARLGVSMHRDFRTGSRAVMTARGPTR